MVFHFSFPYRHDKFMFTLCSYFFIKEHCIYLTPYVAHGVCMQHISSFYAHVSLYHNFIFFGLVVFNYFSWIYNYFATKIVINNIFSCKSQVKKDNFSSRLPTLSWWMFNYFRWKPFPNLKLLMIFKTIGHGYLSSNIFNELSKHVAK